MIRIQIDNIDLKKQEYISDIIDLVAHRISVLKQSLSHLHGLPVDFSTGDFISFKAITKHIFKIIGDTFIIANKRAGYTNGITNYLAQPNNLGKININGLLDFCNYLLFNNNDQLAILLVCDASDLLTLNNNILNSYGINSDIDIKIIRLAFNYQEYDEISSKIKKFFRINNIAKICAYCNIEQTTHQINYANEVVVSFELDHFYDKAGIPLLSYSIFNLVPSDHTCNVTNKSTISFTDEYHLNPHYMGYSEKIRFLPTGLKTNYDVTTVEVEILDVQGSDFYKKINGENLPSEESGKLGNLNVFKIRSKYSQKTHFAGQLLKTFNKENKHFRHLQKYFKLFNKFDQKNNYIQWYEKEFDLKFFSLNFSEKANSKFCRDIHDFYFISNKTIFNKYIIELINV